MLGHSLGLQPQLLALLLSPIATELPETLNAIIWVRQGKDTLAMGNITGAILSGIVGYVLGQLAGRGRGQGDDKKN